MSNLTKSIPADERKMLRKAFWRSFTLYAAVSPAKQGASGFCYSLMPFINKFYKNDEEGKKAALTRSMSYFNTTITCSTFIMGLVASMEKKNSEQKDFDASSINAVKSSLMGPLAGIGDSLRATVEAIIGALAAGFAMNGSIFGAILFFVLGNAYYFGISYFGFFYTYKNGMKVIRDMNKSGILDRLMESATILGMTAVGALIPSWVGFKLTSAIQIGDYVLNIQQELDNIIPGLAPLALTICLAWLYKKNVSSLKLVGLIFVFSLIISLIL